MIVHSPWESDGRTCGKGAKRCTARQNVQATTGRQPLADPAASRFILFTLLGPKGAASAANRCLWRMMHEAVDSKGFPAWAWAAPGQVHAQPHCEPVFRSTTPFTTLTRNAGTALFQRHSRAVIAISLSLPITMLPALVKGAQNGLLVSPLLTTVTLYDLDHISV